MFISDEKVEEVRAASDIVDVVSDYVRLKKRGANYFGLCPFHHEKTPSFSVNPSIGIFKCFGCGQAGNVFQFVMNVEKIAFPESVRALAERAGIALPEQGESASERSGEIDSVYYALRFAARFFYQQLTQTDAGKRGLEYFRKRGFSAPTIRRFGLGYAPDEWDALAKAATEEHISSQVLEKAGLVIRRKEGEGVYDRFRGRVIFPIFSHVGKVLGFGGRILASDADQPKYINSPETDVYNKSRVLYGLYQAKQEIRRREEAILVEGYTDVISLHQAGVVSVVASSGTALTVEQIRLLGRYAKRLILLYDADSAGANAALRGIDLALARGVAGYAGALPAGEDPDSYVQREGGNAFRAYLEENRHDFVSFKYAQAQRSGQFDTPEGQAGAMRSVVESIACMPDPLMQETYMRRAGAVLGVPDIRLYEVLEGMLQERRQKASREAYYHDARSQAEDEREEETSSASQAAQEQTLESKEVSAPEPLPEEKTLVRLMLEKGEPMVEFVLGNMGLEEFTEGAPRNAVEAILQLYEAGAVDARHFLEGGFGADLHRFAAEVLMDQHEPSENWEIKRQISVPRINEEPFKAATSAMTLLKIDRVNEALEQHRQKMFRASQEGAEVRSLQEEMMELYKLRKRIEQQEFINRPND